MEKTMVCMGAVDLIVAILFRDGVRMSREYREVEEGYMMSGEMVGF